MMKKALIFVAGMATMLLLMVVYGMVTQSGGGNILRPGLTMFEKDGEAIVAKQVKVMQVLEPNFALAHATNKPNEIFDKDSVFVCILGEKNTNYYDDQKINIPEGKTLIQVGRYQYEAKVGIKTVPVVQIK